MKVTNKDIIDFAALQLKNKKLPVRVAYAISVNSAEAEAKIAAYDEQRKVLLEKHAVKGEDGKFVIENGNFTVKDPIGWNNDIQELLNTEAEMNVTTFSLDDLAKCDNADFDTLTIAEITAMKFMIM
jgi:hypothetical protein